MFYRCKDILGYCMKNRRGETTENDAGISAYSIPECEKNPADCSCRVDSVEEYYKPLTEQLDLLNKAKKKK